MLGSTWTNKSADEHTMVVGADINTKNALSDWQTQTAKPSVDNSFVAQAGRLKSSTKAAATIKANGPNLDDQEDETQLPRYWAREKNTTTVANSGAKSYEPVNKKKTSQPQYDVNLGGLMSDRPDGT